MTSARVGIARRRRVGRRRDLTGERGRVPGRRGRAPRRQARRASHGGGRVKQARPARAVEQAPALLRQLQQGAQDALENLRDLARGIYPALLADQGLPAALEAQARKVPMPVSVETDGIGRYPQEFEAAVYFCVLEALQNASKYAGASQISVRVSRDDGDLVFAVADDGRGFDRRTTPPGTGLRNMADRLAAEGGSLEIRSRPGSGTTVIGRIPGRRLSQK